MKSDSTMPKNDGISMLETFLHRKRRWPAASALPAVSLFSGAGLSDLGYEFAGFRFCAQVELAGDRVAIGQRNFPHSAWKTADVRKCVDYVVTACEDVGVERPALLVATPPCQGMSSSNPSRGRRKTQRAWNHARKNKLVLAIVPVVQTLKPRIIITENVRQIRTHTVRDGGRHVRVLDVLAASLPDYEFFETTVNMADYGIPQTRYRAITVGVHTKEDWLPDMKEARRLPWPMPTHGPDRQPWVTVREWLTAMAYPSLSSVSERRAHDSHPLHFVPHYGEHRHLLVKHIPPHSGRSAYENDKCPTCHHRPIVHGVAICPACCEPLYNRPIVIERSGPRLIKGFKSSYRRMRSDEPAPTVTTNSSHVGSDNKIHPWQHRVLSILECADLQGVPRCFDWSPATDVGKTYLVRNVIGEALPPFFTYLHGRAIRQLLMGQAHMLRGLAAVPQ